MPEKPKKQTGLQAPKYCRICSKRIEPGEFYQVIVKHGKRYFHARCLEAEMREATRRRAEC